MSSALTILTTCWLGIEGLRAGGADGVLADAGDDVAGDADVDVGLEQGGADLAQDLVDVGLGQAALAAEPLDDAVEAVGEGVEHACSGRYRSLDQCRNLTVFRIAKEHGERSSLGRMPSETSTATRGGRARPRRRRSPAEPVGG